MSDSSLTDLILSLAPQDGSSIGNGAMMALLRERVPSLAEHDYLAARDALVDDGLLARGRGRGGSIKRVPSNTEDADDGGEAWDEDEAADDEVDGFELIPTNEITPRQRTAAGRKKAARKPDGPVQVLSYRHGETRVNNPEVGMVHAGTDPDGEKTTWAYDPHLDPVLNFDSARAGIEKLIDNALASDDPERMRDALTELKRLQTPYLNWTGKAERTSVEVDTVSLHVHERVDPATILAKGGATRTLRVDSKVLEKAEIGETALSDKHYEARLKAIIEAADIPETRRQQFLDLKKEELLREIVDNVGKRGAAGQDLQNVISVAMLSEGWDAKNVTHIMGLRAFTSQLLCEQVVGRGLRRVSYDTDENGLFLPEYVNVFGVPLSISETGDGGEAPPPPKPTTQIEVVAERAHLEIRWPNVLRVETVVRPQLNIDWSKVAPLVLDPASTPISAELAPALGGATDLGKVTAIDLEKLPDGFRLQRLVFQAARKAFAELSHSFAGTPEFLTAQLVKIVEAFLQSDRLEIPSLFHFDPLRRRILIALNIDLVVQHVLSSVSEQNTERLTPIFDEENPIGATGQMRTWYTSRPCFRTTKSHISHLVGDSAWEGHAANVFEKRDDVEAYAKNDHLGFQIYYMWAGSRRRYVPDFIIRLSGDTTLALEIKGIDDPQNRAKRDALDEWVRAINATGGFGRWAWDVAFKPGDVQDIIMRHTAIVEPA